VELGGLEPPTSWVRSTDSPARFRARRCRLAGSLRAAQLGPNPRMHADDRRLHVIQALLAISASTKSPSVAVGRTSDECLQHRVVGSLLRVESRRAVPGQRDAWVSSEAVATQRASESVELTRKRKRAVPRCAGSSRGKTGPSRLGQERPRSVPTCSLTAVQRVPQSAARSRLRDGRLPSHCSASRRISAKRRRLRSLISMSSPIISS
jgi:hypothetical protein